MTGIEILDLARESLWLLILLSAPAMLVALVVGAVIGILQALTQVQEMTLVFVPKILAIFAALILFLPFMGQAMALYMATISERIVAP